MPEQKLENWEQRLITISAWHVLPNESFDFSQDLRIIYVIDGEISIQFTSGAKKMSCGDIEIIGINEPVHLFSQEDNTILVFTINGDFAKSRYERIDRMILNCNFNFIFPSQVDHKRLLELKLLLDELLNDYIHADVSLRTKAERILSVLVEHFDSYSNVLNHVPNEELHKERFNNINAYIMDNLNEKILLADLVGQEYISSQYLSKEFKKKYGISFSELLSYYRIIHSVRLLTNTTLSLSEVSEQCGFSAIRYYYKYFKNFLGISPSEFRQRLKECAPKAPIFIELNLKDLLRNRHPVSLQTRIICAIPPIPKNLYQRLFYQMNRVFRKEKISVTCEMLQNSMGTDLDSQTKSVVQWISEIQSDFDGIVLMDSRQKILDAVQRAVEIPVIGLWEAAEAYLQLNGFSFERLTAEELLECDSKLCVKNVLRRISQLAKTNPGLDVVLLEGLDLFPYPPLLQDQSPIACTDGIREGALILNALLDRNGINFRSRLRSSGYKCRN